VETTVSGQLKFKNGAAFIRGHDFIYISHGYGDIALSEGFWRENDASFEIPITRNKGEIWARVFNREGVLTAEGVIHLSSLDVDWGRPGKIQGVNIEVTPAKDHAEAIIVSAESRGLPIRPNLVQASAQILGYGQMLRDKSGQLKVDELVRPSSFLLQASLDKFWPTLKIGFSGGKNVLNIFSDSLIETFLKSIDALPGPSPKAEKPIAWGSITKDGKNLENAVVDLAFTDDEEVVYFSGPIPDRLRQMTDTNGQFAIINQREGLEILRVQQLGERILPTMIALQAGHVTDLSLNIGKERKIEFQVREIFTQSPVPAQFNFLGEEDVEQTDEVGFASVRARTIEGLSLVEFDAGPQNYMVRVGIGQHTHYMEVPSLSIERLKSVGVNSTGGNLVAGRIAGEDFEVSLEMLSGGVENPKVFYMDSSGNVRNEKYGPADGYFILDGVPTGLQSVVMTSRKSGKASTQLVLSDDRAVHYFTTNLSN